jgi:hypothetical protein
MPISHELIPVLKKLRLSGVLQTLDLRTREAVDENLGHPEFLFRLCTDEVERREAKQLEMRLRRASFGSAKRLEDFEWSFNPKIPKRRDRHRGGEGRKAPADRGNREPRRTPGPDTTSPLAPLGRTRTPSFPAALRSPFPMPQGCFSGLLTQTYGGQPRWTRPEPGPWGCSGGLGSGGIRGGFQGGFRGVQGSSRQACPGSLGG